MVTVNALVYESTLNSTSLPFIDQITVQRTEGMHDLISVSMGRGAVGALDNSLAGKPVLLNVHSASDIIAVRGYLDVAAPARTDGSINSVVHILGTTHVLRNSTARAWAQRRVFDIVHDELAPYRLAFEMDPYPTPVDFISQGAKESDWQLLNKLAKKIGYALICEGVVVRLVDVASEERRTPFAGYETLVLPSTKSSARNVSVFKATSSTTPADVEYKDMLIVGADRLQQSFSFRPSYLAQTADIPPDLEAQHNGTFTSMSEAMIEAARINRQARWTNTAEVACYGFRDLHPGRCALVLDRDGVYGGYWFITDVKHVVDVRNQVMSTSAMLCRDSIKQTIRRNPVNVPQPVYPLPRLVSGRWQSDRQWERQLS